MPNAFTVGVVICFVMVLNVFLGMLMTTVFRLRILEIGLFYSKKKSLLSSKIGHTVIKLGWLPITTYLKLDSDYISEEDRNLEYKLSSKSTLQRTILFVFPSLILLLISSVVYVSATTTEIHHFSKSYLDIMLFKQSIKEFYFINVSAFKEGYFIFCLMCAFHFIANLPHVLVAAGNLPKLSAVLLLIVFFITLPIFRVLLFNFSFSNLIWFTIGGLAIGFISYFILKIIRHIIPSY